MGKRFDTTYMPFWFEVWFGERRARHFLDSQCGALPELCADTLHVNVDEVDEAIH